MMREEILCTEHFYEAFSALVPAKQKIVIHKIRLLLENPESPSLRVHRYEGTDNAWECYIDRRMRIIFERGDGGLCLRDVGYHAILGKVYRRSTTRYTYQLLLHPEISEIEQKGMLEEEDVDLSGYRLPDHPFPVFADAYSTSGPAISAPGMPNYLQFFQTNHLRVLGVPADLVQSLKDAPSLEAALALPDLPDHTRLWLEELSTSPALNEVRHDSSRLLFRTTLNRLEGYCEGKIKHLMLNLQPEQREYVEAAHVPLIILKGMGGSGKTTVGIYRAIRLAEQGRSVLMLTYSDALASVLVTLIEEMIGPLPDNLEVMTLYGLLARYLGQRLQVLEYHEPLAMKCLRDAMAEVSDKEHASVLHQVERFFEEEIRRVIKGLGVKTSEEYRQIKRSGRKVGLTSKKREIVWKVYDAYQRRLNQAESHDWADAASLFLKAVCEHPFIQRYDDIIIDEAQDLTCMDLRAIQQCIAHPAEDSSSQSSMTILDDAVWTGTGRGFTWKQAGINARGHTVVLRTNYRNTRQIIEAAAQLLQQNTLLKVSHIALDPEAAQRQGALPILLRVEKRSNRNAENFAQIELVKEHILDLVSDRTFRLSDIALICRSHDFCRQCQKVLRQSGLPATMRTDRDFHLLEEQIKILTIQSARGLEFPVVFLMGLVEGELPAAPRFIHLDEDERLIEIEKERSLCYVGMTRAAEALYLLTVRGKESRFIQEMERKITIWQ